MSHYTVWTRSKPEFQELARTANHERSKVLKRWLQKYARQLQVARHSHLSARDKVADHGVDH